MQREPDFCACEDNFHARLRCSSPRGCRLIDLAYFLTIYCDICVHTLYRAGQPPSLIYHVPKRVSGKKRPLQP